MNILQDFKERFLTFETVKGIYLLPAGGIICYVTLFYLQYVIQAFCLALGIYMMGEGFRKIGCVPPFTRGVLGHEIGLALGRALRPLVQDYP
jgi:hypothetical protein